MRRQTRRGYPQLLGNRETYQLRDWTRSTGDIAVTEEQSFSASQSGFLAVTAESAFVGEGVAIPATQESFSVEQTASFTGRGGGAVTGSFSASFTGTATSYVSGTLAVTDWASTFDTDSTAPSFTGYGAGYVALSQSAPMFTAHGAGATIDDLVLNVSSFSGTSLAGTTSHVFEVEQSQGFSAYGAGSISAEQTVSFTSIALTGGVARLIAEQSASFSGTGDVIAALGTIAVTQPAMVANYGAMVVEQAQAFSGGSVVAQNNLVAYSMNIKTAETTTYNNFAFKFIIRLGHEYYGVKADGLYQLGGLTDDGTNIDARFKTAETDFGSTQLKRVPFVYLDSDTDTTISSIADGVANTAIASAFNGRRTHLARGPKGRFWQMEIANVNGSELKVGALEMMADVLSRKV